MDTTIDTEATWQVTLWVIGTLGYGVTVVNLNSMPAGVDR